MTSFRRVKRMISLPVLLVAVGTAAAGCGGHGAAAPEHAPTSVKSVSLRAGEAVPRPKRHVVLTIAGAIGSTNDGGRLDFDIPTLDRMGLRSIKLYEPFKKRQMTFRAIPVRNLLAVAKVGAAAATLHTVALNDYSVDIPLDIARGEGIYLATHHADGSPIAIKEGGPIRIVFLDGAKGGDIQSYWNWSLDSVEVK